MRIVRLLLPLSLAMLTSASTAHGQWAYRIGGSPAGEGYAGGSSVILDGLGHVYVAGSYHGLVTLDPRRDPYPLPISPLVGGFIAKYDTTGTRLWGIGIPGDGFLEDLRLGSDAAGNVYLAGDLGALAGQGFDFDPGPGVAIQSGYFGLFFAKYNSDGALHWVRSLKGEAQGFSATDPVDMAVDEAGNVYLTGTFLPYDDPQLAVDFDPGPGSLLFLPEEVQGALHAGVFVAKYTTEGDLAWAFPINSPVGDEGYGIALDGRGGLYVTGGIGPLADFDPGAGQELLPTSGPHLDVFVAKYSTEGEYVSAFSFGADEASGRAAPFDYGTGITVDEEGSFYVTGRFNYTIDADPGPGTAFLVSRGEYDTFLAKYDAGNQFQWAISLGNESYKDAGSAVRMGTRGDVYLAGYASGAVDLDPGSETWILNGGSSGNYVARYTRNEGELVTAFMVGGSGLPRLAVDPAENLYLVGTIGGSRDFDPDPEREALLYGYGAYLAKYDGLGERTIIVRVEQPGNSPTEGADVAFYPNPFSTAGTLVISLPRAEQVKVVLYDVLGRPVSLVHEGVVAAWSPVFIGIRGDGLVTGLYFVRVMGETFSHTIQVLLHR